MVNGLKNIQVVKHDLPEGGWIGVISDTHIPARARFIPVELMSVLEDANLILHAGDLVNESVLAKLGALAPVEAVAGNMDSLKLHHQLGYQKIVAAGGFHIGLMHGKGRTREAAYRAYQAFQDSHAKVNAVIFGHTHFPILEYHSEVLLLNPGSPVEPRMGSSPSFGRMWVEDGALKGEIVYL